MNLVRSLSLLICIRLILIALLMQLAYVVIRQHLYIWKLRVIADVVTLANLLLWDTAV